jgi:hypothetical protein
MTTIPVRMLCYTHGDTTVRPVEIPDDVEVTRENVLDRVFFYGQNDFAEGPNAEKLKQTICSVSVGDVVELPDAFGGGNYIVAPFGFVKLTDEQYEAYRLTPRRDRFEAVYNIAELASSEKKAC